MVHYDIGLEVLRSCKDDLEVDSFLRAIKSRNVTFDVATDLVNQGANGIQLRLALLAHICAQQEDMVISARQLIELELLLEQVVVFEGTRIGSEHIGRFF